MVKKFSKSRDIKSHLKYVNEYDIYLYLTNILKFYHTFHFRTGGLHPVYCPVYLYITNSSETQGDETTIGESNILEKWGPNVYRQL